jgi:hypothetical protein
MSINFGKKSAQMKNQPHTSSQGRFKIPLPLDCGSRAMPNETPNHVGAARASGVNGHSLHKVQPLSVTKGHARDDSKTPPRLHALDVGDDNQPLPPRQWLLGTTFCRAFVSGLIGPGAGGKTSLRIVQSIALASDRPLTGERIFKRCRCLFVCLEDGLPELRRRVRAAMKHHNIKHEDVQGYLFVTTPTGMKLARYGEKSREVIPGDLDAAIRAYVDQEKIDLVCLDPIKKSHSVEENNNDDMDAVVGIMTRLAIEKNIAFDILSHERKSGGPEAGDANRARGAGAMKDGGRLLYTITGMTEDESKKLGVTGERKSLFRVDSAKVNIAPPSANAQWFRLVTVNLDNGDVDYPDGDEVQTVERWKPPGVFEGFLASDLNKALEILGTGMGDGRRYSAASSAKDRAAWRVLHEIVPSQTEERCRAIIAQWKKSQVIVIGQYHDEKERKMNQGIISTNRIDE